MAAVCHGYGVQVAAARAALATFGGVRRRQELLFEARGVRVYDDFAHHPTAVDETLRALRNRHPDGALWAVFEPRCATACRAIHQQAYLGAFGAATRVVLAPLGRPDIPAGERRDHQGRGAPGGGARGGGAAPPRAAGGARAAAPTRQPLRRAPRPRGARRRAGWRRRARRGRAQRPGHRRAHRRGRTAG
ncbi:MAG: cyanophycin synthetase [Polyangiaceae bacterium]